MTTENLTDSWLVALEPPLRRLAEALRRLIMEACPGMEEAIKWGNPVFEREGKVCYLAATRAYVSLGFFNGAALSDSEGILEGTGKKMRHVKLRNLSEIRGDSFSRWVRESVELNLQG